MQVHSRPSRGKTNGGISPSAACRSSLSFDGHIACGCNLTTARRGDRSKRMWKRFRGGTVLDPRQLKDEGLRILLPWDKMFIYDLRLQTTTDTYNAITKDGVSINATISIWFRLKHDAVPQLHQAIGPDYIARLVRPEIGSRAREVIAEYTAEEVYSTKRQDVQRGIRGHTQRMLAEKTMERTAEQSEYGDAYKIPMDELLNLLDTRLCWESYCRRPLWPSIGKSSNTTCRRRYIFRVARERRESERKKIEAEGISEFQRIVSQGISDSYLRWRGIDSVNPPDLRPAQRPENLCVGEPLHHRHDEHCRPISFHG